MVLDGGKFGGSGSIRFGYWQNCYALAVSLHSWYNKAPGARPAHNVSIVYRGY